MDLARGSSQSGLVVRGSGARPSNGSRLAARGLRLKARGLRLGALDYALVLVMARGLRLGARGSRLAALSLVARVLSYAVFNVIVVYTQYQNSL